MLGAARLVKALPGKTTMPPLQSYSKDCIGLCTSLIKSEELYNDEMFINVYNNKMFFIHFAR